ncbi:hypothetical protein IV203_009586 [Nitzschia inconspicua]|uniref:Uncharacterized protein n=1 Tax=Nitzschia inconspicua TaxID=303405 RepID=A0A9K3KVF5_9STRA|nr:hypothetical protein IV203_009586 [Nitzschia inconspicua]
MSFSQVSYGRKKAAASPQRRPSFSTPRNNKILSSRPSASSYGGSFKPMPSDRHPDNRHNVSIPSTDFPGSFSVFRDNTGTPYSSCSSVASLASLSSHSTCSPNGMASDQPGFDRQDDLISEDFLEAFSSLCLNPGVSSPQQAASLSNISHFKSPSPFAVSSHYSSSSEDDDDDKMERKPAGLETRGHGVDFMLGDQVYVTEGQLDAIGSVTWKNDESVSVLFEIPVDKVSQATHAKPFVGAFPPRVPTFPPRQKVQQTGLSDVTRPSIYSKKVTTVSSNDETLAGPQRDSKDKSLGFKSMPPSPGLQQPTASPGDEGCTVNKKGN